MQLKHLFIQNDAWFFFFLLQDSSTLYNFTESGGRSKTPKLVFEVWSNGSWNFLGCTWVGIKGLYEWLKLEKKPKEICFPLQRVSMEIASCLCLASSPLVSTMPFGHGEWFVNLLTQLRRYLQVPQIWVFVEGTKDGMNKFSIVTSL